MSRGEGTGTLGVEFGSVRYLVRGCGDEWPAEALGDLLLLLRSLLGGGAVGVELAEAGEEDEAAERGAGGVEHQLLHEAGGGLRRPHPASNRVGGGRKGVGGPKGIRFVDRGKGRWLDDEFVPCFAWRRGLAFLSGASPSLRVWPLLPRPRSFLPGGDRSCRDGVCLLLACFFYLRFLGLSASISLLFTESSFMLYLDEFNLSFYFLAEKEKKMNEHFN